MAVSAVKAKFVCQSVTKFASGENFVYNYKFSAVTHGSPENEMFWKWTPSGNIELNSIRNDLFEVGKSYYIDFSQEGLTSEQGVNNG